MFLDIPLIANLITLQHKRQWLIDENLRRQNRKRHAFDYQPNQEVMLLTPDPDKLQERAIGPFRIHQAFTNGTVSIWRTPDIVERVNIRRIKPFRRLAPHG